MLLWHPLMLIRIDFNIALEHPGKESHILLEVNALIILVKANVIKLLIQ